LAIRKFIPKCNYNPPQNLNDHPFYGLSLDEYQVKFRDAIWDPNKLVVLCNSKAGTGKSTIALGTANLLVQYGFYDGIVYIMFPTQEQRLGYLPGTLEEKSAPYMQCLYDACYTIGLDPAQCIISEDNIQNQKEGKAFIKFTTDTFMRGINIENKIVIVEESQNSYIDEMKKVCTRVHDSCKLIMIGHSEQCDLIKKSDRSGFAPYLKAFQKAIDDGETRAAICDLKINHRGWISTFCDDVEL
jgi:predicted ribonuclease YlaK